MIGQLKVSTHFKIRVICSWWLTPWFWPFILDPLSYPCLLISLISRLYFFNTQVSSSKRFFLVVSLIYKNSKKYSFVLTGQLKVSTHLKIRVICSWWLTSGVQSRMIEKYFASLTFFSIIFFIWEANNYISSFCIVLLK